MSYPNLCNRCKKDCQYTLCAEYQKYIRWWWKRFKAIFMQPAVEQKKDKFVYAHPDQVRRYLEEGLCKDCRIANTCDTACKAYAHWWDARLLTPENIAVIKRIKIKEIHFAWDQMKNSKRIIRGLNTWKRFGKKNAHGSWGTVYVLTNFDTTMAENLFRIYKLQEMDFVPYVMVYDKPNAPYENRLLQRWCNNKVIFKSCPRFEDYDRRRG